MDNKKLSEILNLQSQIINKMAKSNMENLYNDLWGSEEINKLNKQNNVPPQGLPELPDLNDIGIASPKAKPVEKTENTGTTQTTEKEEKPENIEDLKKELDEYIGLAAVKDEVKDLINLVSIQKLRKEHGLKTEDLSLHMVFSGNPGTGKTMVARLMSRIYKSLGILSKGHLVEVDRSGLVAGFVGQTAIKTSEQIQKAMGGVLFIDEAYALTNKSGNDFGQEAVDTILKAMEDNRENLVVIVAGYTKLMANFVHSNPGLESRFNRFIHFEDYTPKELMEIFEMRCNKSGYVLAKEAKTVLHDILLLESLNVESFGNARGVRNIFEKAIVEQANRLAKSDNINKEMLMELNADDIRLAGGYNIQNTENTENEYKGIEDNS